MGWRSGSLLLSAVLCGCAYTPSTMMMDESGHIQRCAAWGTGVGGVVTAKGIHDSCVSDMQKIGYVPIPPAQLGMKFEPKTVRVAEVINGGPASEAGILPGDTLQMFDGNVVGTWARYMYFMSEKNPGDVVTCVVIRNGEPVTVSARLAAR